METNANESRRLLIDALVFCGLVALGTVGRHAFPDLPNFTPTVAVSLFAGYYFRRLAVAMAVPFLVMVLSNLWLPNYDSVWMKATVYLSFFLPVVLPHLLRRLPKLGQAASFVLLPSTLFFLITNLVVWARGDYTRTLTGLLECYTLALPFYRRMLLGDLLFIGLLFGSYAVVRLLAGASWTNDKRLEERTAA